MKAALLALVLLATALAVSAFDSPPFEVSEESRGINGNYHNLLVDNIACNNAFTWSNSTTSFPAVLAQMTAQLNAGLSAITTDTFRQCDRLSSICYQCENGALNVSIASVDVLKIAKLACQANNMLDSFTDRVPAEAQTFTLLQNTIAPILTAKIPCRINPNCFPTSTADLMLGELQGERKITFKRVAGQVLIDRINTGGRYTYFSGSETSPFPRILNINYGMQLVPDSIIDDRSLTGIFCFPAKRSIVYYTKRGIPFLDDPS